MTSGFNDSSADEPSSISHSSAHVVINHFCFVHSHKLSSQDHHQTLQISICHPTSPSLPALGSGQQCAI